MFYTLIAGHILQVFNAQVPVRSGGTFASGLKFKGDYKTLWQKIHYKTCLLDPAVAGCITLTMPLDDDFPAGLKSDYPAYMLQADVLQTSAQRDMTSQDH